MLIHLIRLFNSALKKVTESETVTLLTTNFTQTQPFVIYNHKQGYHFNQPLSDSSTRGFLMKILMVASEAVPYAKTGGLADVAGVLPKFLTKAGHDVRVVIPLYSCIQDHNYPITPIPGALGVWMGVIGELWCEVFESTLPDSGV